MILALAAVAGVGYAAFKHDRIGNHSSIGSNETESDTHPPMPMHVSMIPTNAPPAADASAPATNSMTTNTVTTWQAATTSEYARLINEIRNARGNR